MKPLNTFLFISNAAEELANYKRNIKEAETYDAAKRIGSQAIGYTNCMVTFLNTMICKENNDFTADFDEVIDEWWKSIIQAVIDKAADTSQPCETITRLCSLRDNGR